MCDASKPSRLADADTDYFRNIVSLIKGYPEWVVDDEFGDSIDHAVDQAATGSRADIGELRFTHVETGGQLYVRLPYLGSPPGAIEALLEQPLDPLLDQVDSDLAKDIGDAHHSIVDTHTTQYITGQSDPYTVLVVTVPLAYSEQELRETVDAVSTVSKHVADLHRDIRESIDTTQ